MASGVTERKLAAIMIADVAGFSRLMEHDESLTFARLRRLREEVIQPKVGEHGGRLIKTTGDGFLAEFPSATAALKCGIDIQRKAVALEANRSAETRIRFRIGINVGDIIIDGDDVAGDGVNIAARLEPLARPDGICISGYVREQIHDDLSVSFEDMGEQKLKNIERPIHAFAVTLVDEAGALAGFSLARPVPGFGGRPAIAVLPFDNLSTDPEQAYFADGIAEDILTRLAMWRWMPVIARNSSFAYRGKAIDLKQIGAALGARYILEGSVRKSGDRVRISGQLIDTDTGHHVWAQRYDRVLADIFTLQDEITDAIVTALEPAVGRSERGKAQQKGTQDLNAWELYQRGAWYAGQYTPDAFKEAATLWLAAAERDKQFSMPLAAAAFVKLVESLLGWSDPAEAVGETYRLALTAKSLDPLDPVALAIFGMACAMIGQHDAAIDNSRRSVELNPSSFIGHGSLGFARFFNGQPAEAAAELETAIRLSPNEPMLPNAVSLLASSYYMSGDYGKSLEIALIAVQRTPQFPLAHRHMANALGQLGRVEEGRQALARLMELAPGYSSEVARRTARFRHEADFEHYMAGLRKLGWSG